MLTSGVAVILASALFLAYDYNSSRQQMVTDLKTTAESLGLQAYPALDAQSAALVRDLHESRERPAAQPLLLLDRARHGLRGGPRRDERGGRVRMRWRRARGRNSATTTPSPADW